MFGLFRRKEPSHEEKLDQAYSCYKKDMVGLIFPKGKAQADIIVKSMAKIINVDLSKCSTAQYYDILSIYSDTLIRIVVTKSKDETIIASLQVKHKDSIHSKEVARKVLAYCILNIKDNYFGLTSDADFYQLEKLLSYSAVQPQVSPVTKLFTESYNKIRKCLSETEIWVDDYQFEIVPLLVVLSDFIAMYEKKDRQAINQQAIQWACAVLKDVRSEQWLDNRVNLYGQIIRSKKIRGDWLFGDTEKYNSSPILRCVVAFGDILVNPSCADNYDEAPWLLKDFTVIIPFAAVITSSVVEVIASFCDNIATL